MPFRWFKLGLSRHIFDKCSRSRKNGGFHVLRVHYVSGPRAQANKPFVWINRWEWILSDLSTCRLNRVQENAMIYIRTSGVLCGNDDDDDHMKDYRRKTTSSSSSFPLLLILSHDDLFLFYWCWTSTLQSGWIAMKIPWAIAPKAVKRWWKILYIQKCLDESYTKTIVFLWE